MQQSREVVIDGRRYRLVPVEPEPIVGGPHPEPCPELTDREAEVVELVARGYVNKQIAATLDISEHTVSTHLRRIFAKLGVDRRAAMVHRYTAGGRSA